MKDNSLDEWIDFFDSDKSMTKFKALLDIADKSYLFQPNGFPPGDLQGDKIPAYGFLEKDLRLIMDSMNFVDEDLIKQDLINNAQTRIVLALASGIKFEGWLNYFGDNYTLAVAKSLVEAKYELFDIDLENIVKFAITCGALTRDDFFGVALMRGNILNKRYPTEKELKELKKTISLNKFKVKMYSLTLRI